MPVSYGSESLKVQAVCARSFAYAQLLNPSFGEYGAHLDDSVNSQVYNNAKECAESIAAVDDTCGQVLYYGDELVTTYFFSTSCGYTSNVADVWSSRTSPAYLTGGLQAESEETLDLSKEKRFRQFIDDVDAYDFYEQEYGWFRWNVTITKAQMQDTINANLADVAKYCTVKQADGSYKQQDIAGIGTLKSVSVDARGTCGVITKLRVVGSDGEVLVGSEYAVRKLLGSAQYVISLNDNTTSQQAMLPSGYFYMDETTADDGSVQYEIHGGGYGHGVGMSQNGVKAMCQRGYTFEEILLHYYPDTECRNIY
jgi:stage II sporulation protein D